MRYLMTCTTWQQFTHEIFIDKCRAGHRALLIKLSSPTLYRYARILNCSYRAKKDTLPKKKDHYQHINMHEN